MWTTHYFLVMAAFFVFVAVTVFSLLALEQKIKQGSYRAACFKTFLLVVFAGMFALHSPLTLAILKQRWWDYFVVLPIVTLAIIEEWRKACELYRRQHDRKMLSAQEVKQ